MRRVHQTRDLCFGEVVCTNLSLKRSVKTQTVVAKNLLKSLLRLVKILVMVARKAQAVAAVVTMLFHKIPQFQGLCLHKPSGNQPLENRLQGLCLHKPSGNASEDTSRADEYVISYFLVLFKLTSLKASLAQGLRPCALPTGGFQPHTADRVRKYRSHRFGESVRVYFTKFISTTFLLLISSLPLLAQENEFSQYQIAPLQLNPAEVAHSSDWRVMAHYRGQQVDGDVGFRTTQLTVARPLFWGKRRYAGVGVSVLDQRSAHPGWFQFQRVGLSLAHEIPVSRRERLSLGLQTRYQAKRLSTEGVRTGSQFLPGSGFDPTLGSGEDNGLRTTYFSINAGGLWYLTDRHEQTTAYLGLSAFDLNRPRDTFFDATSSLPVVLQAHGGFRWLESGRATVSPEVLWNYRAGIHLFNLGSRISYLLGSSRTPSATAPCIDIVPRYTLNRSASLILQWHTESYTFGVSYDRDASFQARENPLRSAFELVVAWHQPVKPKSRTSRKKKRRGRRVTISRGIPKLEKQSPVSEAFLAEVPDSLSAVPVAKSEAGLLAARQLTLTVEFAFNRSDLDAQVIAVLREVASFLQQQPSLSVTLTGHADGVGTPEANQRISVQRAQAVRDYLVQRGIAENRLKVVGRGAQAPLYPNTQEVLRAKNRRVEIGLGR